VKPYVPFLKVVVDPHEEKKFCRRAIAKFPAEYYEVLWGFVRRDTLYICVFASIEHKGRPGYVIIKDYEEEMGQHEDEVEEAHLEILGAIHSHTVGDLSGEPSSYDLTVPLEVQQIIVGVCSITQVGKSRHKTTVRYWPRLQEFDIEYRKWKVVE
jgi:hypothetical protein